MRERSKVFEAMWRRRKRVWDEIAKKERRYAEEAIFRTMRDKEGGNHNQEENSPQPKRLFSDPW